MAGIDQEKDSQQVYESRFRDFLVRCPRLLRELILTLPKVVNFFSLILRTLQSFLSGFQLPTAPSTPVEHKSSNGKNIIRKISVFAASGLLVLQFTYLASFCFQLMEPMSIVLSSKGPDAAQGVDTAMRTTWTNDNNYFIYPNVFYRVAYTIRLLAPDISKLALEEQRFQEKAHLSLMLASLIALYGVAYLLARPLSNAMAFRLVGTVVIVSVLLSLERWWYFTYMMSHPDIVLAFVAILFVTLLSESIQNPEKRWLLIASAVVAGIGFGTKISFLIFYPALIFLFCPPFKASSFINAGKYAVIAATSYMIVGFPQNLRVGMIFWFLDEHSIIDAESTATSFFWWWKQFFVEGFPIALVLVFLFIIFQWGNNLSPRQWTASMRWRVFAFAFLPMVLLSTMNWVGDNTYYLFPILAAFYSGAGTLLASFIPQLPPSRLSDSSLNLVRSLGVILLLFVVNNQLGIVPRVLEHAIKEELAETQKIKGIFSLTHQFIKDKKFMLYDPYAPIPKSVRKDAHFLRRETLKSFFNPGKVDVLIFDPSWYDRFMKDEPDDWDVAGIGKDEWWAMHEFYSHFIGKTRYIDHNGKVWIRTYVDDRKNQIWEASN